MYNSPLPVNPINFDFFHPLRSFISLPSLYISVIQAIKARVMYLPNIYDLPLLMSVLYIAHFSAMYVLKLKDNVELNKKSLV